MTRIYNNYLTFLFFLFFYMYLVPCFLCAMSVEDFDGLTTQKKKSLIKAAIRSWLDQTKNVEIEYSIIVNLAKLDKYAVVKLGKETSMSEIELKRIEDSYFIHKKWYVAEKGVFKNIPDINSFNAYDSLSGEVRTYSSLSINPNYFTGFITTDAFQECKQASYPEILGFSRRCETWETPLYVLKHLQDATFSKTDIPGLILCNLPDSHCEAPELTTGQRKIWFDPAKDFLIVKQQRDLSFKADNYAWWMVTEVLESQYVDGVWFPVKFREYGIASIADKEGPCSTISATNVTLGKLNHSDMTLLFPQGIKVVDKIRGVTFDASDDIQTGAAIVHSKPKYNFILLFIGFVMIITALFFRIKRYYIHRKENIGT